jgi:hypothetical protein
MPRRRLLLAVAALAVAAAVLLAIALASFDGMDDGPPVASIDEARGTYRAVGVGDDAAAVRRIFGQRPFANLDREPAIPTNAQINETGGPAVINLRCKPTGRLREGRPRLAVLRYDEVAFFLCDDRVFAWIVIASDARTARGVSVGDDLEKVPTLYPALHCDEAPSGDLGSYPYCAGAIRSQRGAPRLHVWFGDDPIASITISTTRYGGYEK